MIYLAEFRKRRGLTQAMLAEMVNIGVNSIARYERGEIRPSIEIASKIAKVLEITVEELLNGPAEASWELRLVMRRAGDPQEGVMDMTTSGSNAALYMEDNKMAVMLSADYSLWEDDAKFEELIEQLRRKRALGLKSRHEDW